MVLRLLQSVLLCGFLITLPYALGQGHGCDDDFQEDADRSGCPGADHETVEESCRALNCTWCPTVPDTPIPWCYTSKVGAGYVMVGEPINSPSGARVELSRTGRKPRWDNEVENLILEAEFQSNDRLRIKITPASGPARFEVPIEILPATGGNANPLYDIQFENSPLFSFKVIRKSTGTVLFDTTIGQKNFVYADQYLSMNWQLPSENVYGIGENEQTSFRHDFSANKKYPLWARDHTPEGTINIYGVQPYYTVLETDGNAHSVAIVNSNAQEFTMRPGGAISYITIGGVLDFYFFLGPTPENTVQQYTGAVGRAPMPPYWGLGFQLCRYGYDTLDNMKAAVDRTAQYDIPHDVQYGDIDIMDRQLDFTYSTTRFGGLPEYVKELKTKGIKFVTILDPCISIGEPAGSYEAFELGQEMDVWVKRADGSNAEGKVWPNDPVYFPDYSKNATKDWWNLLIRKFHDLLEYDGLWIDMNEPANFVDGDTNGCPGNSLNSPPFVPSVLGGRLWAFTLCADTVQAAGKHYDIHSLYGWFQSEPTLKAAQDGTGKRALVLSRSTFLGSGRWTAHWLGDNFSRWSNLHFSIIGMLQYNHFGIPLCGSDICGFNEQATAEMCQRWQQLGAFYPFSRNHNVLGTPNQDPGFFGPAVANSTRTALRIRYNLLPYLYTLFHIHHTRGDTVARALWHLFPKDQTASGIDRQFMWGTGLMVSPVLEEGATSVQAYFPDSRFYNYYDGVEIKTRNQTVALAAPLDYIPLHIHGGSIMATQAPERNTELARENPFGFIVALDDEYLAEGDFYLDDGGDTIDPHTVGNYFLAALKFSGNNLTYTITNNGYTESNTKRVDSIRFLGLPTFESISVNGVNWEDYTKNDITQEVVVQSLNLLLNMPFSVYFD